MGCVVNGPGEAREADLGVAGGRGTGLIFRRGQKIKKVSEEEILPALVAEAEAQARAQAEARDKDKAGAKAAPVE